MTTAPYPEPQGAIAQPGFVKTNPRNNDYYVEQFKDDPWYEIILSTHRSLKELIPNYNIAQIKEKFGGLRYYVNYPEDIAVGGKPWNDTRAKLIDRAENIIQYAEAYVDGFEAGRKVVTHKKEN